jgi:hypothetical protein
MPVHRLEPVPADARQSVKVYKLRPKRRWRMGVDAMWFNTGRDDAYTPSGVVVRGAKAHENAVGEDVDD